MTENTTPAKGSIVRIGKGSTYWQIIGFSEDHKAIIVSMSRNIDGTFERTRYIAGRQMRRVESVERLVVVEGVAK